MIRCIDSVVAFMNGAADFNHDQNPVVRRTMSDYPERLRRYNRAGQVQYEWFEEVANHIEELEDVLRQVDAWSDSWGTDPEAHLEPVFIKVKEVLTKGPPQNPTSSN